MCGWYLDFCGVEVRHLGRLGLRGLGGRYWLGLFLLLGGHADVPGDRDRDRDRLGHTLGAGLGNGTSLYPPPAGEAEPLCPGMVPNTQRKAIKGQALMLLFETHCSLTIDPPVHLYRAIETRV